MKRFKSFNSLTLKLGSSNHLFPIILISIIFIIAFIVRLHGINFGLPYIYSADEHLFVEKSVEMLELGSIDAGNLSTPSTTTLYIIAIIYFCLFIFGSLNGDYQSMQEFLQQYQHDPTIFYLSGRISILIFGVLSVYVIYRIGRRLFNPQIGLLSAAILAVIPIHVEVSRLIRPDIQMTFFIVLVFWFSLDILDQHTNRSYILSGFVLGLAIVSKYPAVIAVILIIGAHLFVTKDLFRMSNHFRLILSGLSCLLGMFVGAPTFFFNLHLALTSFLGENTQNVSSKTEGGIIENLIYYSNLLINSDLGLFGIFLLLMGILLLLISRKPAYILLLIFPIVYIIAMSLVSLKYNRYMIPSLPFFAIIVAYSTTMIFQYVAKKFDKYLALIVNGILLIALFAPLISIVIVRGNELSGPDTRTVTRQWMLDNLPPNSNIFMEFYSPQLNFGAFNYYGGLWSGETELRLLSPNDFKTDFVIARNIGGRTSAELVLNHDIDYVIMTEFYHRYLDESDRYTEEIQNYETLIDNSEMIYEIKPISGYRSGPPISVYKLVTHLTQ